ncbi:UvrD-helicase domain-containing protein [soil metagenome]
MPPKPLRLQDLNPPQREAARQIDGPVLILAGAGTGKTRVITTRITYMVTQGIDPAKILAVTFTNKAATEMRERVGQMVRRREAKMLTICTFHSLCVRILRGKDIGLPRGNIQRLGYKPNFTIYTGSDQLGLLRKIIAKKAAKDEKLEPGAALALISRSKNKGIPVADSEDDLMSVVFQEYQASLRLHNAVDFDDLLGLAADLLEQNPDLRDAWRHRFGYIMVDEFQDTNRTQMELLRLLGREHMNVCVVGDDDQSIYGWRGAEISNILDFERFFPRPKVVKLEENYRSTNPILETANAVIRNNKSRREKRLWSGREGGEKVRLIGMPSEKDEADIISSEIWEEQRCQGRPWEDFAILFRMNSQSRLIEAALRNLKIPYRVVGAQSFFERREVKDVLAYFHSLVNPDDDINLLRIINNPPRGISNATVTAATEHSVGTGTSVFTALKDSALLSLLGKRAQEAVGRFVDLIEIYGDAAAQPAAHHGDLCARLLKDVGFVEAMKRGCKTPDEADMREANVLELLQAVFQHHSEHRGALSDFLTTVALDDQRESEQDDISKKKGVCLITLHAAKGLEFPVVYLVGLEEGILPHKRSLEEDSKDEERRLLYVGITRAMERMTITYCLTRMKWGQLCGCQPSTFINELPPEFVEELNYDELVNQPATPEAATGYFAMMKARLGEA